MRDTENKIVYNIQTVSRALEILNQFLTMDEELGISDLSRRLNLQKNNVFRLMATLKAHQYLEVNALTGKYRLGLKSHELGQAANRQIDLIHQARPYLNSLYQKSGESCYFSVIKDSQTYYLDGIDTCLPLRVAHHIGDHRPLHCTAAGKIQLAYLSKIEQRQLLNAGGLVAFTPHTITNEDLLQRELYAAAKHGFALEKHEHIKDVVELAVPVFDIDGSVIGALSIAGPSMRLTSARIDEELTSLLCREAALMSRHLGQHASACAAGYDITSMSTPPVYGKTRKHLAKPRQARISSAC